VRHRGHTAFPHEEGIGEGPATRSHTRTPQSRIDHLLAWLTDADLSPDPGTHTATQIMLTKDTHFSIFYANSASLAFLIDSLLRDLRPFCFFDRCSLTTQGHTTRIWLDRATIRLRVYRHCGALTGSFCVFGSVLSSPAHASMSLAMRNRSGLDFMRWSGFDHRAQDLNGIQRPKLCFQNS
jgi:hypothetical protein